MLRLNVPIDVSSAYIVGIPGSSALLDGLLELKLYEEIDAYTEGPNRPLTRQELDNKRWPRLRFTLRIPGMTTAVNATVEMTEMDKDGDTYVIGGTIDRQPVRLRFRLNQGPTGHYGVLDDKS